MYPDCFVPTLACRPLSVCRIVFLLLSIAVACFTAHCRILERRRWSAQKKTLLCAEVAGCRGHGESWSGHSAEEREAAVAGTSLPTRSAGCICESRRHGVQRKKMSDDVASSSEETKTDDQTMAAGMMNLAIVCAKAAKEVRPAGNFASCEVDVLVGALEMAVFVSRIV